jgi:hypothetical protein
MFFNPIFRMKIEITTHSGVSSYDFKTDEVTLTEAIKQIEILLLLSGYCFDGELEIVRK